MNDLSVGGNPAFGRKQRLKNLLDEGQQVENLIAQRSPEQSLKAVRSIIGASDVIIAEGNVSDRAEHTTEVVMDAQVLNMNHELVSRILLQRAEFNDCMYQNALTSIIFKDGNDSSNWHEIAKIACKIARTTRLKSAMFGAINIEPKIRVQKERQTRRRTTVAVEKRPETVDKMNRRDKGACKVNIIFEQLQRIIAANNGEPVPFFKLVIDAHNFANTVENVFQMSFLARDNMISIDTGDDGFPHVRLTTPNEYKSDRDTSQSISMLNVKLCQDMIIKYNIKEPMLKVRPNNDDEDSEDDNGDGDGDDDIIVQN